jgi:carbon-monoxide dehydrogenase large subunit
VAHLGVTHIDMPLTPERVWRAINAAKGLEPPSAAAIPLRPAPPVG